MAIALIAVVAAAGTAVYLTSLPSPSSTTISTSSATSSANPSLAITLVPNVPLIAPGQTQNYTSIEVSSNDGSRLTGTVEVKAIAPSGLSMILNGSSIAVANNPQSIALKLKADLATQPGMYRVIVEASSAGVVSSNKTFTVEVVPALVIIQGLAFHPQNITVSRSTPVYWINLDSNIGCCDPGNHNVVFLSGANASSPILKRFDRWTYTFAAAGTAEYECTIHPLMRGQVTISA
jgi:plastocyanin